MTTKYTFETLANKSLFTNKSNKRSHPPCNTPNILFGLAGKKTTFETLLAKTLGALFLATKALKNVARHRTVSCCHIQSEKFGLIFYKRMAALDPAY
jgi:hypothetical protein